MLAGLEVLGNISIHAGPVVALEDALFCFGDTPMAGEEPTVGLVDEVWDHRFREDKNGANRGIVAPDTAPNDAVVDEAMRTNETNQFGEKRIRWNGIRFEVVK